MLSRLIESTCIPGAVCRGDRAQLTRHTLKSRVFDHARSQHKRHPQGDACLHYTGRRNQSLCAEEHAMNCVHLFAVDERMQSTTRALYLFSLFQRCTPSPILGRVPFYVALSGLSCPLLFSGVPFCSRGTTAYPVSRSAVYITSGFQQRTFFSCLQ